MLRTSLEMKPLPSLSIESSSRSEEGHGGLQMSPELLNEVFSTKSNSTRQQVTESNSRQY